jgi:hypothetical protein
MYELFFKKLSEKIAFTQDEQTIIKTYLTQKNFEKSNTCCRRVTFVK